MNYDNEISLAVRRALLTGAAVAAGTAVAQTALAQETQATEPAADEGEQMVVVTGTRIRRVEAETANPLFVIDSQAIAQSGVQTIGDLVQQIPSISGAATNPQVNNGGGNGDSNVELRGLDPSRTLVLLNGRRIGILGQDTGAVDVNIIPLNLIERVDVLKEGAGAIYGSDAIAGVVNFITKQDFEGFEGNVQYGETDRSDGKHQQYDLTYGFNGDRGNLVIGGAFNHQDSVSAGDRKFSRYATYFYAGSAAPGGSSRSVGGRIDVPTPTPASMAQFSNCDSGSITRITGSAGTSPADFRCFVNVGAPDGDRYNFQPVNLLMTPQDRGTLFLMGHFDISDKVSFFSEALYNRTHSGFQIASLPFTSISDDVVISKDSIYNPFGVDFGGIAGLNPQAQWRMEALGGRRNEVTTNTTRVVLGLRGDIKDSSWQWEGSAQMGRMDQDVVTRGYLFKSALQNAFGPSFIAADGTPTCGTLAAPISGCTPVNIFNLEGPGQGDALKTISADSNSNWVAKTRGISLTANGDVFQLPAGAVQAAVGFEYQKLEGIFDTDYLTQAVAPLFLTCLLASETCTSDTSGTYNVKEGYAEVHVPLLKDMPAVHALDLTLGTRYSDYSLFGSTTNSVFKLEYRPIKDMLIRASYTEVFRVPTIYNLYQGPTHDSPTFIDPCVGLDAAAISANPNLAVACPGVVADGNYTQANGQVEANRIGNPNLKPESGDVLTYGVVYDPNWLSGLSMSLDFWRYKLDDLITRVDPNFTSEQCVATGDPFFCSFIQRYASGPAAGDVLNAQEPWVNLGTLKTQGVDFGVKYTLRNTRAGSFRFSLDTTYTNSYKNKASALSNTVDYAGTYGTTFGNYAKYRSLGAVGWSLGSFDGLLTMRYIHKLTIPDADGSPAVVPLAVPHRTYFNLTLGYELPTKTKIQIGVINLTDEAPPLMYFNNTLNANTDVSTYDTLGRQFFIGIRQKF